MTFRDPRRGASLLLIPWVLLLFLPGPGFSSEKQGAVYPAESCPQTAAIEGIRISFCALGKGYPVLFLHGLGGSWRDWAGNLPYLAPTHQVVALDFPGFGHSDQPAVEYSIEWLTVIVEKFLKERGIAGAFVVGHSMGGLVALNLAARPNSPVLSLVICDAVGIGDKAQFLSYALSRKIIKPDSPLESFSDTIQEQFAGMLRDFVKRQDGKSSREFFESLPKVPFTDRPMLPMTPAVQLSASIIDFDIRSKLARIKQPTLIIWGARDPIAPPADASFLHGQIPQSSLLVLPGVGHTAMSEEPVLFNQELLRFLQATVSGSSK